MDRRAIAVRGTVQGVGFRPFVYGLACRLQLGGFVRNDSSCVSIEIEGDASQVDQFMAELTSRPPPLARIEHVGWEPREPIGDRQFRIEHSMAGLAGSVSVSPDVATCAACLRELFDLTDRRYRYPFLNCTNCGPRLTIIRGAPYDRERTTMAGFPMCFACRAEYDDPLNRRFHAQPTACPDCGPHLSAADAAGNPVTTDDPLRWFVAALRDGNIGAMKGLGGYHMVCDARNASAVVELRRRKRRDDKPFAVMVRDLAAAEALCDVTAAERDLLLSPRRPIVLLQQRPGLDRDLQGVAPGRSTLGVMLPYTPLHHLLLDEAGDTLLVMTSGNRSDEPIAYREPDVFDQLRGIADLFLTSDRPIHVRCDDSVTRVIGTAESPIRRSRGSAPQSIPLPIECPVPILATGGQLKCTFALGDGRRAIPSHHMGDLDHFEAYRAFERDIALYEQLLAIRPRYIAHDLHPDYASTRYALARAAREGILSIAVQHHHAHVASCMAEHGLTGPAIGISFDGSGFGPDGTIWGGEILVADLRDFRRAAHLRCVRMPGGEQAVREPWRMAVAHLDDAGVSCAALEQRRRQGELQTIRRMLERRLNSPVTSSAGRLFDAIAALVGIRDVVTSEGQAAIELEALASTTDPNGSYPFDITPGLQQTAPFAIDTRPILHGVVTDVAAGAHPATIARRFHDTMVEVVVTACTRIRQASGITDAVLSGGVFMNSLLTEEVVKKLGGAGFCTFRHRLVPTNDGGLSLGQLAVAACTAAESIRG